MKKVIVETKSTSTENVVSLNFHPNLVRKPLRYVKVKIDIEGIAEKEALE